MFDDPVWIDSVCVVIVAWIARVGIRVLEHPDIHKGRELQHRGIQVCETRVGYVTSANISRLAVSADIGLGISDRIVSRKNTIGAAPANTECIFDVLIVRYYRCPVSILCRNEKRVFSISLLE